MDSLSEKTIDSLRSLVESSAEPRQCAEDATHPYVIVPNDCTVKDLSGFIFNEHQPNPERAKGTAKVLDAGSFCEYFTLFRDTNSRVFADETASRIVGVLDYHESQGKPRWGQHRVELTLRHSEEWKRWTGANGNKFSQIDFAEFIEANAPDIVSPSPATMLEVARDLSAKNEVDFASQVTLSNGSVKFKFTEQVKATFGSGEVSVPEVFRITIPIHVGADRTEITARLRWRIKAGKLTFWYDLLRADVAERNAFLSNMTQIANTLGTTIINGTPA